MPKETCSEAEHAEYANIGCQILDAYLEAFNTGDTLRWAASLHYPHVRITGEQVQVWDTPEAFAGDNDLALLAKQSNWAYSKWMWRKLVHYDPAKMQYLAQSSRHTQNDICISSAQSLYVITRIGSRWAVQSRSTYVGACNDTSY